MKVYQLITSCLSMCGESFDSKLLSYTDEQAQNDAETARLLTCFNVAMCKIHNACLTALCKASVIATQGKIDTKNLKLFNVLSLKDSQGNNVKFRFGENCLHVDQDGKYFIAYIKHYKSVNWTDDVIYPSPMVGQQLVIYSFASEFYRQNGKADKQQIWQQRFEDSVKSLKKLSNLEMPIRRWL